MLSTTYPFFTSYNLSQVLFPCEFSCPVSTGLDFQLLPGLLIKKTKQEILQYIQLNVHDENENSILKCYETKSLLTVYDFIKSRSF